MSLKAEGPQEHRPVCEPGALLARCVVTAKFSEPMVSAHVAVDGSAL